MVKVYDGEAYGVTTDERRIICGTREYLKVANVKLDEATERDVPDSDVDRNGKYVPDA